MTKIEEALYVHGLTLDDRKRKATEALNDATSIAAGAQMDLDEVNRQMQVFKATEKLLKSLGLINQ